MCVCCGGDKISRSWAEGGKADAGFSSQPPVGGCHEAGSLFVAGEDEADAGAGQRIEEIEVFLAGNTKDIFHALRFETFYKQV